MSVCIDSIRIDSLNQVHNKFQTLIYIYFNFYHLGPIVRDFDHNFYTIEFNIPWSIL